MIQAGLSTIFCVCPLLLIDSYMVYVFAKTIFLVIFLGLLHGIIFLPALLLSVGCSPRIDDKVIPMTLTINSTKKADFQKEKEDWSQNKNVRTTVTSLIHTKPDRKQG